MGIGRTPPVYLQPGDEISISITGLGKLTNRIADIATPNPTLSRMQKASRIKLTNTKSVDTSSLTAINGKPLYYKVSGSDSGSPIIFIHGLGATTDYWTPLIQAADLSQTHALHFHDLEGHGLSPTSPLSTLSVESFAADVKGIFAYAKISSGAIIVAH